MNPSTSYMCVRIYLHCNEPQEMIDAGPCRSALHVLVGSDTAFFDLPSPFTALPVRPPPPGIVDNYLS